MKTSCVTVIGVALLSGASLGSAFAQQPNTRTVEQYRCKDVMREHGADRDVMIAFLHGFLLGKSGSSTFDRAGFHRQTRDFIDRCLDNPSEKAVDVMEKVKG
jgi:hypothetical protein